MTFSLSLFFRGIIVARLFIAAKHYKRQHTHSYVRTQISQSRNEFGCFLVGRSLKSNVSINLTVKFLFIWMFFFVLCVDFIYSQRNFLFLNTISTKRLLENMSWKLPSFETLFFLLYFFLNDGNRSFCMYDFYLALSPSLYICLSSIPFYLLSIHRFRFVSPRNNVRKMNTTFSTNMLCTN